MPSDPQLLFDLAWASFEPWHNKGLRTTKETLNRLFREQLQACGHDHQNAPDIWEENLTPRLETWAPDRLQGLVRLHHCDNPRGPRDLPILIVEYDGRFFIVDG